MIQNEEENTIQTPVKRTWYKRGQQPSLDALPSAAAQQTKPMLARRKGRAGVLRRFLGGIGMLVLLSVLAIFGLMNFLQKDRVTALAKDQIARLAGEGYITNLTSASLNFFQGAIAGVEIQGISIRNAKTNAPLLAKGNASFAISLISLLTGKIQLTDLSLADAEMHLAVSQGNNASLYQSILGPDGLVDPALVAKTLDNSAVAISNRLAANPDLKINAQNTRLVFGLEDDAPTILIETLLASRAVNGDFAFSAAISNADLKTQLRGAVGKNSANGVAPPYSLTMDPIAFSRTFTPQPPDLKPRSCTGFVGFAVAASNGLASVDVILSKANCSFGALGDYAMDATINGKLKRGTGIFEIGRGLVNVNRSVFNFDGAFAPARYTPIPENAGETSRYRYELVFGPSKMDSLDNEIGPLPLTGKIAGTYAPSERRLALDEFTADANGSILRGAASLLFTDVTPALYVALTSDKMPIQDFKRIWPRFAVPNTRRIVIGRVNSGTIRNMRFELQLPPGKIGSKTYLSREQLSAGGDVEGASFITFGDLPPVQGAKGRVAFDGVSVDIQLESGSAILPSGRDAKVKPSSFVIADTHQWPITADLNVELSGNADAIAEIAALKPINAFQGQDISPDDLSGKAEASAKFKLTFAPKGQKPPIPDYSVSVKISDLAVSKSFQGQKITGASGTIKANNSKIDVSLDANISGLPAKIKISEPTGAPEKRTQDVSFTLTDALRDKFAPGLKPFLSGPVTARIEGSKTAAKVELDLTKAALRIVPFNWEKGAGIGAKANFSFAQDGGNLSISNLEITGRGLEGSGKILISDGALRSADLKNVRLNPGDNFSLSLKKDGQSLNATLGGAQFDARAIMKQMLPGRAPRKNLTSQALEVNGKIKRLIGFNDEAVLNADIGFTPGKNSALSLSGEFENGGTIDLSRTGGSKGRLVVQTGNAGAALRFVDLYKRMIGGTLTTDFKIGAGDDLAGPISISNFTVVGEPRLAKLANEKAAGSASLAEATKADLTGEKAKFELAQGNVTLENGTISLRSGIVRGANVGATAEGIVLSASGKMDLRGTFMPARGLNRIVGAIPILGLFLGSGSNAGLIGITYQLAGDAKNPKVFINPISMIAPGIFRQIFE